MKSILSLLLLLIFTACNREVPVSKMTDEQLLKCHYKAISAQHELDRRGVEARIWKFQVPTNTITEYFRHYSESAGCGYDVWHWRGTNAGKYKWMDTDDAQAWKHYQSGFAQGASWMSKELKRIELFGTNQITTEQAYNMAITNSFNHSRYEK